MSCSVSLASVAVCFFCILNLFQGWKRNGPFQPLLSPDWLFYSMQISLQCDSTHTFLCIPGGNEWEWMLSLQKNMFLISRNTMVSSWNSRYLNVVRIQCASLTNLLNYCILNPRCATLTCMISLINSPSHLKEQKAFQYNKHLCTRSIK